MGKLRQFVFRLLRYKLEIDFLTDRISILEDEIINIREELEEIRSAYKK